MTRPLVYPIPFKTLEKELGTDIATWIVVNEYKKSVANELIPENLKQWYRYWEIETFQDLSVLLKKIACSEFKNPLDLRDKICKISENLEWYTHVITYENILEANQ
jgi:hypothetical protein